MNDVNLKKLIEEIKLKKSESQTLEIKAAHKGCPTHLRKTLSSFSNQDQGGIILFGLDEENDFEVCGVYDAQDLQKKLTSQAQQMSPEVFPQYTVGLYDNKTLVTAEIPGISYSNRPCFDKNNGIQQGSYKRRGDQDILMTPQEIFNYQVFRHSIQIDKEEIDDDFEMLDQERLDLFLKQSKKNKRNFASIFTDEEILKVLNIKRNRLTKAGALIFSKYPQTYFPQLSIHAVAYPGNEVGEKGSVNERFLDNKDITGPIPDMLDEALEFIQKNIREKTIIDNFGHRTDRFDYPIEALREAILNALIHRDYSYFSIRRPVKLDIFKNRIEITSPGGLFGNDNIDELGLGTQETRNPNIVKILSILGICENRYSGIPIMRRLMKDFNLPEPVFKNNRNEFKVIFYNENFDDKTQIIKRKTNNKNKVNRSDEEIIEFCSIPRSRQELNNFFENKSNIFSDRILPLVRKKVLEYTIPEHPKSPNQKFVSVKK